MSISLNLSLDITYKQWEISKIYDSILMKFMFRLEQEGWVYNPKIYLKKLFLKIWIARLQTWETKFIEEMGSL